MGIIALAGLDAETGVVMLLYLDLAYEKWKHEGRLNHLSDLKDAIMFGAVKRIRPENHDRQRHSGRPDSDHVFSWHRRRRDEEDCGAHGWRRHYFDRIGADHIPRYLSSLERRTLNRELVKNTPEELQ